ncbi:MAG: glycoside hydrolase family 92 protein [Candidatus Latescibacteria bacterium]|nr:glycoside hydrolase family 92 protein [Candidatus Latescibacterota bacterium]
MNRVTRLLTFTVIRVNRYIKAVYVNGREWSKPWFVHSVIVESGNIVFEMGPNPNKS